MSPAKPTAQDEANFMEDLLSGIDASFFDAVPSPDPISKKQPEKLTTPYKRPKITPINNTNQPIMKDCKANQCETTKSVRDVDMDALLEGAEAWDWDDMEEDFLSPSKRRKAKVRINLRKLHNCCLLSYRSMTKQGKKKKLHSRDVQYCQ